jgi:hypothetical protein
MEARPLDPRAIPRPVEALLAAIDEETRYISQIRALLIAHEKSLALLLSANTELERAFERLGNNPAGQPRGTVAGSRPGAILGCLSNTLRPAEEPGHDDPIPGLGGSPEGVQPADGRDAARDARGHQGPELVPRDADDPAEAPDRPAPPADRPPPRRVTKATKAKGKATRRKPSK